MKRAFFQAGHVLFISMVGMSFAFSLASCGGMNHEPESPEEYPQEPIASTPVETATPNEETSTAQSGSESDPSGAAEPASRDDLKEALQVVIQDEALLNELKLGEPGRFPLKISGSSLESGLQLQAHSEAVEVVDAPQDPKTEPVLVFTDIDMNGKQGTFKYRYEVEGVRGTTYVFKNAAGVWELKSSRVTGY